MAGRYMHTHQQATVICCSVKKNNHTHTGSYADMATWSKQAAAQQHDDITVQADHTRQRTEDLHRDFVSDLNLLYKRTKGSFQSVNITAWKDSIDSLNWQYYRTNFVTPPPPQSL